MLDMSQTAAAMKAKNVIFRGQATEQASTERRSAGFW
jgi:hypothetical protein